MNIEADIETNNNEKQNKYGTTEEQKRCEDIDFNFFLQREKYQWNP